MSGKPYTMKELKSMVDFLIEHNAYSEIRGRKFWINYANSKLTKRTWQSLKETFLKRILPDIHNPYYKLTIEQISSFKGGYDVSATNKHGKLILVSSGEEEGNNDETEKDKQQDKKNMETNTLGENINSSTLRSQSRSSTETLVLEKRNDDKSVSKEQEYITTAPAKKSISNYITFSDPLSPFVQQVIDDFDTDEESDNLDPKLIINEDNNKIDDPINENIKQKVASPKPDKLVSPNKQESATKNNIKISQIDPLEAELKRITEPEITGTKIQNDLNKNATVDSQKNMYFSESLIPNNQEARKNKDFDCASSQKHVLDNDIPTMNNNDQNLLLTKNVQSPRITNMEINKSSNSITAAMDDILNDVADNVDNQKENISNGKIDCSFSNIPSPDKDIPRSEVVKNNNDHIGQKDVDKKVDSVEAVVILKTHSQSQISDECSPSKEPGDMSLSHSKERKQTLTNLFGLKNGFNGKKRYSECNNFALSPKHGNYEDFESSEWTSESDNEYVSPPHGRRNRYARKYLKPRSGKIFSLDNEGGLFVVYGNKVYPLIRDGGKVKSYLTYLPGSEENKEESFWKLKYAEEKKKASELERQLNEIKSTSNLKSQGTINKDNSVQSKSNIYKAVETKVGDERLEDPDLFSGLKKAEVPKTVKIKFTKNSQEIQIEGERSELHPYFDQIVKVFNKDNDEPKKTVNRKSKQKSIMLSSGETTPVPQKAIEPDPAGISKVDILESEIFKEIEEKDKAETNKSRPNHTNNINTRKKRDRSKSPLITTDITKKQKVDENLNRPPEVRRMRSNKRDQNVFIKSDVNVSTRTKQKSPDQDLKKPATEINASKVVTRRSLKLISKETDENINYDTDILYRFPSPPAKSYGKEDSKTLKEYHQKITSPPDIIPLNSLESTQGYQDSDVSPLNNHNRRKKCKPTYSFLNFKKHRGLKKLNEYYTSDISSESSNSATAFKKLWQNKMNKRETAINLKLSEKQKKETQKKHRKR